MNANIIHTIGCTLVAAGLLFAGLPATGVLAGETESRQQAAQPVRWQALEQAGTTIPLKLLAINDFQVPRTKRCVKTA